jgi:hypothetical protein
MQPPEMYPTDDHDMPKEDQRALVIFQGGNGDFYVQVTPLHGKSTEGVRLCTSGGASSRCPGLTAAIADAYRAMKAMNAGETRTVQSRAQMEEELEAWRASSPKLEYRYGMIVEKDDI